MMAHWSYRIVKYADGNGYGLHEVYYDENDEPESMTAEPIDFVATMEESPEAIKKALEQALDDCGFPVFDEPPEWQSSENE